MPLKCMGNALIMDSWTHGLEKGANNSNEITPTAVGHILGFSINLSQIYSESCDLIGFNAVTQDAVCKTTWDCKGTALI